MGSRTKDSIFLMKEAIKNIKNDPSKEEEILKNLIRDLNLR